MKHLLILFMLALQTQANFSQTKKATIVNENWMKYDSISQRIDGLQIRPSLLNTLTTEDLLYECLNFPYLIDFYLYGGNQHGFELLTNEFNGLRELLNRTDLPYVLLDKIQKFSQDFDLLKGNEIIQEGRFSLQNLLLEYILIQDSVVNNMTSDMFEKILSALIKNYEIIFDNPNIFSQMHEIPINRAVSHRERVTNNHTPLRIQTNYSNTTIYTPRGSAVSAGILAQSDLSPAEYAYYINEMSLIYSQAEIIEGPTMEYNCHAYAWHISEGGSKVWLDTPNHSTYWNDGSYVEVPETIATKVLYVGNHSAIRLTSSMYMSKWGILPLVKHAPNYVPTEYSTPYKYYIKAPFFTGPNLICSQGVYTINSLSDSTSVALNTNYSATGYSIQVSSNLNLISYSNGSLTVQKVSDGKGYIKVYYKGFLLSTKEMWVGGPIITDLYYDGNYIYSETDYMSQAVDDFYWIINGVTYHWFEGRKQIHLSYGTYNVEAYAYNSCGRGPSKFTQIVVNNVSYSLGNVSSDHQVTIRTADYSDGPQPLEVQTKPKTFTVPYTLQNTQTGEVVARGEMPIGGGVLDFSRVRSGLYVLTLTPQGRKAETFKVSFK